MLGRHWIMILVVAIVAYLLGVAQPSYGQKLISLVKGWSDPMQQSSYIAGALILGFIVYITLKGELPAYRDVLGVWSMPFALIFVGAVLVAAGVRGKTSQLYTLVKGDIESDASRKGYIYWMVSILIIGSIGYIEELAPISRAFLALVLVVLLIGAGKKNFFSQFQQGISSNPIPGVNTLWLISSSHLWLRLQPLSSELQSWLSWFRVKRKQDKWSNRQEKPSHWIYRRLFLLSLETISAHLPVVEWVRSSTSKQTFWTLIEGSSLHVELA
jgi:hypothetical protein